MFGSAASMLAGLKRCYEYTIRMVLADSFVHGTEVVPMFPLIAIGGSHFARSRRAAHRPLGEGAGSDD